MPLLDNLSHNNLAKVDLDVQIGLQLLYSLTMDLLYMVIPRMVHIPASHFHLTSLFVEYLLCVHLLEQEVYLEIGTLCFPLYQHIEDSEQEHQIIY